jgi:hypothetical protein
MALRIKWLVGASTLLSVEYHAATADPWNEWNWSELFSISTATSAFQIPSTYKYKYSAAKAYKLPIPAPDFEPEELGVTNKWQFHSAIGVWEPLDTAGNTRYGAYPLRLPVGATLTKVSFGAARVNPGGHYTGQVVKKTLSNGGTGNLGNSFTTSQNAYQWVDSAAFSEAIAEGYAYYLVIATQSVNGYLHDARVEFTIDEVTY